MSTTFQSCPGCDSFILSDTAECPQCGHVFDKERADAISSASKSKELRNQQMYNTCRNCNEQVRDGLVRCWNCNTFVRSDLEQRYKEMQESPQPVIYSETEKRTDYLTAEERERRANKVNVFDAVDDNDFTLRDGTTASVTDADSDDGFELGSGTVASQPVQSSPPSTPAPPAASAPSAEQPATPTDRPKEPAAEAKPANGEAKKTTKPAAEDKPLDDDDLFGIAMQDERETKRRKREKLKEARNRKILLPCGSCGAWMRIREDQSGKTVRCRQCKAPLTVPMMKKKEKTEKKQAVPKIDVKWIDDLRLHVIKPTEVTLKPGSLQKSSELVDACFHSSGLHLLKYAPPKKSLFGKAADSPPAVEEQKKLIREHIQKTGKIANLPFGELQTISADSVPRVRLVQPVAEAHESMFAGVPVFGDGQIAIYLPLELEDNQQAFLSLPLTAYRKVSAALKENFDTDVKAEANGVPAKETYDANLCFLSEVKVAALKNLEYYQNDPAFELEVAGFICGTCGIAVTEEARARKKLGGAAGKGIAKAKCPKCSNKFGDLKAYKIVKSPDDEKPAEEEEDVSEVLRAKPAAKPAAAKGLNINDIKGKWKMTSLGQGGNFAEMQDMKEAGIIFEIKDDTYAVIAGGATQEQGSIVLDASNDPAHFDQELSEGDDKGKKHLGLIKLVDGKLHNCQADFGKDRPTNFDGGNADTTLAIFDRA